MQAPDPANWTIADDPAAKRFVMSFPGGEAFAVYRSLDDYLVISHTEMPATFRGRGIGMHVAFSVGRRDLVETFHRTALAHGGRDAGSPGLRPEYDAHYFGAFVFDPDGNKIEAVTRSSQ